jgi:hypothetical protein
MLEPGLDKHEWESQWQQFEEDLESSPAEALSEVDRLIHEMLESRGYAIDDPVAREGDDREIVVEFVAAREITRQVEQDEEVDPGDIAAAVEGYRSLYEYLIVERGAP